MRLGLSAVAEPILAECIEFPEGADMDLVARYSGSRGLVEMEDVANVVAFLASPAARAFHGDCITIDGGITAG